MKPICRLLVTFALERESRALRPLTHDLPHLSILITGMGATRTRSTVEPTLRTLTPDAVLTCGYAGALDPALRHGDVLFSTLSPTLAAALEPSGALRAPIHCAERIAVTAGEKQTLRQATGAAAVEMESGIIQTLCIARQIPCATLRVISDTASEDLPLDFNQLTGADDQLDPLRLALAILRRPWRIPKLIALGRHSDQASRALAGAVNVAARALSSSP